MRTVTVKLLIIILALFFVLSSMAEMIPGDANNDASVDILDLVAIIDNIVSETPLASQENADANKDGSIDILDLVWIIDFIVNGGTLNPTATPTVAPTTTPTPTPTLKPFDEGDFAAREVEYLRYGTLDHGKDFFVLSLTLRDKSYNPLKSNAKIDTYIVNDAGIEVYRKTHDISILNYDENNILLVRIPDSDISLGQISDGTNVDNGKLYYKVYYPGFFDFERKYVLIFGDLPYKSVVESCALSLPVVPSTISYYSYSGKLSSSTVITDTTFTFEETIGKDQVHLNLYFTGEKTYDSAGPGQSSSCKIGWKLLKDGYVVKSGTHYTPSLAEGEKYLNSNEKIYYIEPGHYELKLMNVN